MAEFRSNANFGMDKELYDKEQAKRDPKVEAKVQGFIEELTGKKFEGEFLESLRDGVLLCEAMNVVAPGAIPKINQSKMPFKQMENISNFLKACRSELGMSEHDLFTTPDLYDERSPVNVCSGLIAFSRAADKMGFEGPSIAPKESKKSMVKRWSLNARNAAVSMLNMGSAGIMDRSHVDRSNDINFGANMSGPAQKSSAMPATSAGSAGIMDRQHLDRSNDIAFGAAMAGKPQDSNAVPALNTGSHGLMDSKHIDRSNDIAFGANMAGKPQDGNVPALSNGSAGIMDSQHIDRTNDVAFGANAGRR